MLNSKKQKIIAGLIISIAIVGSGGGYKYYKNNQKQKIINSIVASANQCIEKENYDKAIQLYNEALSYKSNIGILNKINLVKQYQKDKLIYNDALKEFDNKNYTKALDIFNSINKDDDKYFPLAQNKIKECKDICIKDTVEKFNNALKNNLFNEANKYILNISKIDKNTPLIEQLKDKITRSKKDFENNQNTLLKGNVTFVTQDTLDALNSTKLAYTTKSSDERTREDENLSTYLIKLTNIKGNTAEFTHYMCATHAVPCVYHLGTVKYKGGTKWYFSSFSAEQQQSLNGYILIYNNGKNARLIETSGENEQELQEKLQKYKNNKSSQKDDCFYIHEMIRCDNYDQLDANRYGN